jgi:membrane protein required for colicin V production
MTFSAIDIISLIILVLTALRITFKGFVSEFMSKAGLLVGLLAALMFTALLSPVIDQYLHIGSWSNVISFAVLFMAGFLLMTVLSSVIKQILESLHLYVLDNILGFILGVLEGAVLISLIIFLLKLQTFMDVDSLLGSSWVVKLLEPIAPYGINFVKEGFSQGV